MRRFWLTSRQVRWLSKKSSLTGGWDTTTLILHAARLASYKSVDQGFTLEDVIATVDDLMQREGIEFTGATSRGREYRTAGERVTRGRFGDLRRSGFFSTAPPGNETQPVAGPPVPERHPDPQVLHRLIVFLAQNNRRSPLLSVADHLGIAPYLVSCYVGEGAVRRVEDDLVLDAAVSGLPTVPPAPTNGHLSERLRLKTVLGHEIEMHIPKGLVPQEIDALKAVARHGCLTEQELRRSLKNRRATGLMEVLVHKLQQMDFEALRIEDAGPLGNLYVFDRRRLPASATEQGVSR